MLKHYVEFYGEHQSPSLWGGEEELRGVSHEVPIKERNPEAIKQANGYYSFRFFDRIEVFCKKKDGKPLDLEGMEVLSYKAGKLICRQEYGDVVYCEDVVLLRSEENINYSGYYYLAEEVLTEKEIRQKYGTMYDVDFATLRRLSLSNAKFFVIDKYMALHPVNKGDSVIIDGKVVTPEE